MYGIKITISKKPTNISSRNILRQIDRTMGSHGKQIQDLNLIQIIFVNILCLNFTLRTISSD